jgi:L-seryl-tRNA(Ser) seleniumtransferase
MARRYTNLEYNLEKGQRGHRDQHIRERLCGLLKCEDATACNNAAAAVLLILNTLAENRKVVVSRGELVEIGGSFRIPAIMEKAGVILKEVGTTNRTRADDYQGALDSDTALILRVHPSNYRIVGFTQRPRLQDLVAISRQKGIPLVHDLGSGYLFRTEHPFLQKETTVQDSLEAGADLVCFSGDKLLGGPQAGIILGRQELIARIRKNPLMRVCRLDKMTLAALEATLIEYERGTYTKNLPSWQFVGLSAEDIRIRAEELKQQLDALGLEVEIRPGFSVPGGGTAPEERIPTFLLTVHSSDHTVNQLERSLRDHRPPVLARIEENRLQLDLRTVFADEDGIIVDAFEDATA